MTTRSLQLRLRSPLARQLQWLIAIRLIVITSVLIPAYLLSLSSDPLASESFDRVLRFAGLTYLASLVYLLTLVAVRSHYAAQAYLQFVGDLLLISLLVHETGGVSSPSSMLYLVVISIASVLLRRQTGLAIAGIAWLLYAAVLIGQQSGSLQATSGGDLQSVGRLIYALSVHLLGFYGVAFLTAYLGREAARSEQELAETAETLAELEVLHRDVIESMTSGLITTDLDGKVISINPVGRAILRADLVEVVDRPLVDCGLLTEEQWRRLREMGPFEHRLGRDEIEIERGGARLWIGYSVGELRDFASERRGYTVIFQDLTERRRLQEELRMNDRMAAVGELAAGLAHEIGNPMAAISGSVQMLSNATPRDSGQGKLLDIILQESRRLDRTIKDFLSYARPRPRKTLHFDVARQLKENLQLLENSDEVGPNHRLRVHVVPASATLDADPDQISQIFWNLARNALRAMPAGGTLTVEGRLLSDRYTIRFVDDGTGMTEDRRANLFHPFQSFFDGGTGIGMAIVYRIVEDHGGHIEVESKPDQGTAIEISLPLSAASATSQAETRAEARVG